MDTHHHYHKLVNMPDNAGNYGSSDVPNNNNNTENDENSHNDRKDKKHDKHYHDRAPPNNQGNLRNDIAMPLADDEIELVLQDLAEERASFFGTGRGKQTWSRYFVEKYLCERKWYNPNVDNPDAPSLSKGWAYFEHFTLPRHFSDEESSQRGVTIRAPPGEKGNTDLYNPLTTPQSALSDFGIGVGMYFSTLTAMTVIFLLAGLANISNIIYYASPSYDEGQGRKKFFLLHILKFSAICTHRTWAVCSDCDAQSDYWDNIFTNEFYGSAVDPDTGEPVTLINHTTCLPAEFQQGMWNFGTLLILIVLLSLFMWYLSKIEVRFDEDNSSPTDYTVIVKNPPYTAVDPDEWKEFFEQFSDKQVTLCTVALDNERLLRKLVERRRDMKRLARRLPPDTDFDDETMIELAIAAECQRLSEEGSSTLSQTLRCLCCPLMKLLQIIGLIPPPIEKIWERIQLTTEEIVELQQKEYGAAAVFVTFETELGQRTALEALNASLIEIWTNTAMHLDETALFRGNVLNVDEASEPNAVRWMDLHKTEIQKQARVIGTFCLTFGLVIASALLLDMARTKVGTILFSVVLSTFNLVIPLIVRFMVSLERHFDEGSMQASLYVKITFFRWVNTAFLTLWITPFLATLGDRKIDLINTVNALIISEMLLSPFLRYFDFVSFLNRHYFAPRAKTQEEVYDCFVGGWYNLAERFTDFTKVLLLCIFYSAFYPLIYFLGAIILFIQYWMDKFLLLRSWKKAPFVGPETARFSRTYFTTAALVAGAFSSAYAYGRAPFTFLCHCDEDHECDLPSTRTFSDVELLSGDILDDITADENGYYFCNQKNMGFPPIPMKQGKNKWMTKSQEKVSRLYGWITVILLLVYVVVVLGQRIVRSILSLWRGVYQPRGVDQHKDFSSGIGVESFGYIPQLEISGFHLPFLVCDIDSIDVDLIGWQSPNRQSNLNPHTSYDDYNLIFDIPHSGLRRSKYSSDIIDDSGVEMKKRPIFSIVKQWPPDWAKPTNHFS